MTRARSLPIQLTGLCIAVGPSVRENGVIASLAVQIAIGINWEGQRQVLAVETANRESQSSWKEFLLRLKERGLSGVEFVVSDDHAGLKKAIGDVLSEEAWLRSRLSEVYGIWLPWLDSYRTLCIAPSREARVVFEALRAFGNAARSATHP
jgi:hypothetical protein